LYKNFFIHLFFRQKNSYLRLNLRETHV